MISYEPLLINLVKRRITKTQLRESIGFSTATLAKISKNEYISMETLENICNFLNCKIEDVVEFIPNK